MNKLKARWGVDSNWQLLTIFIAFGITGTSSAKFGEPLTLLLGISEDFWMYWPVRLLIIFPIYQVVLLIVGWIYGELPFFWAFEKKMLSSMGWKRFAKS